MEDLVVDFQPSGGARERWEEATPRCKSGATVTFPAMFRAGAYLSPLAAVAAGATGAPQQQARQAAGQPWPCSAGAEFGLAPLKVEQSAAAAKPELGASDPPMASNVAWTTTA
jgi:hypothetical protein